MNSIIQHSQNRASSHAGQGHKISMAILDRGRSGAIFFRVKDNWIVSGDFTSGFFHDRFKHGMLSIVLWKNQRATDCHDNKFISVWSTAVVLCITTVLQKNIWAHLIFCQYVRLRTVSPDLICLEVVLFNRSRLVHVTQDFKKIDTRPLIFNGPLKFLLRLTQYTYQLTCS